VSGLTLYPTFQEALHLHRRLIEEFGGSEGLRDAGLLESALGRPRSGYYATVYEQAAALLHSVVQNHAFVDGNKRVGFALTAVFLLLNGFHLTVGADEAETFVIGTVIGNRVDVPVIAEWLAKHCKPLKRGH